MMKRIIKVILCLLIPLHLSGQLTPVTNQYMLNPLLINPAYAGNRGVLSASAFFRKQWVGVSGSPETTTLSVDAPAFEEKIGLGLTIVNDKIGVTKETQIITNYAYKIEMGKGMLSFGLGAGLTTTNTAWSDLVVIDPGDELYLLNSRLAVVPNFSFGSYYSNQNYFAGFSIPRFINYKYNFNKNKYNLMIDPGQYNFMLSAGSAYTLSPKIKIFPSTLIIISPGQKVLLDLNANMSFQERFLAGASYRIGRSFAALFQFQVNNQLKVAYTYDFDFGKLRTYSNGSHEIMLRYEFKYKVDVINPLLF